MFPLCWADPCRSSQDLITGKTPEEGLKMSESPLKPWHKAHAHTDITWRKEKEVSDFERQHFLFKFNNAEFVSDILEKLLIMDAQQIVGSLRIIPILNTVNLHIWMMSCKIV